MHSNVVARTTIAKTVQIERVVLRGEKTGFPIIAASDNVTRHTR